MHSIAIPENGGGRPPMPFRATTLDALRN